MHNDNALHSTMLRNFYGFIDDTLTRKHEMSIYAKYLTPRMKFYHISSIFHRGNGVGPNSFKFIDHVCLD